MCTRFRPLFDQAQSCTLIVCFVAGAKIPFFLILTRIIWLWYTSCTELSSVQIILWKVSLVSMHILGNSCHFTLLAVDIIDWNLVLTTVHFIVFLMYLPMVDELISRETSLAISLYSSTEVTSSYSSIFLSRYAAISTVILDFAPQWCWSCSPRPENPQYIHFRTVWT